MEAHEGFSASNVEVPKQLDEKTKHGGELEVKPTPTPVRSFQRPPPPVLEKAPRSSPPAPKAIDFENGAGDSPNTAAEEKDSAVTPETVASASPTPTPTVIEGTLPAEELPATQVATQEAEGEIEHEEERDNAPLEKVPYLSDNSIPRPDPNKVRLSYAAINGRLRRVMQPNMNGDFKVSDSIRKDFLSKGTPARKKIELIFQMCGFHPDSWIEAFSCRFGL